ncbi:Na(+)/H(+) antiporter subunit D [Kineobactrum sediminis]|uniref:Na(+)/H(+) antiporter subunit D n=1 Tax=Kineobactrum sediminis TaxID=1905677 RepID=A0A2N5Y325_9GAMM|nr:Na(+)/H(+) antiporter subunit D [Kineobactrum sediminis]PLW82788.1 Na(+)/H(+) antiporter subunit D [Kineobactrum sediminis]
MFEMLPPALALIAGALLTFLISSKGLRAAVVITAPLICLYMIWQIPDGVVLRGAFLGYPLELVEGSPVRRLFATIFAIMAATGAVFAFNTARRTELVAAQFYAAGAIGVCFAGDLLTLFVYWELMALFSTVVVWCGGTEAARAAGIRYAIMHLLGGVVLKVGIEGLMVNTGSLDIRPLLATDFSTWMILIGILINAAAPPVSAWLSDAYPTASPSGSVFLSAFTTKTAILALILLFPGEPVLIGVGLFMVFYGIIYALLENDIRRILAFSIVNQVGFMVVAVGIGTEMAINGAAAHAFAHIIYKALLFMSAGVVVMRTGKTLCTDVGGLFRTMPVTMVCGVIGALAISSFPLTSGFTTKTMISQAAMDESLVAVYFLLAAASAGVFLHAGIKFPWFVFFQKDSGLRPKDAPWNMTIAMVFFAGLCILLGIFPELLYPLLPYAVDYVPYKMGKVLMYLQLLLFSGLAFFLLLPWMQRTRTISLDVDWLWRRGLPALARISARLSRPLISAGQQRLQSLVGSAGNSIRNTMGSHGPLGRSWEIGTTALWIALLLMMYVVFYYLM